MGRWWCTALSLAVACGGRTAPPAPEPTVVAPAEVVAAPAPPSASPEALYAECRDRVEGPEAAEFTSNADKTIYGGFMSSASAKGATSGVLSSIVRFSSPKTFSIDTVLRVSAGLTLVSA